MPAYDRSWTAMDDLELPDGIHLCANYVGRAGFPVGFETAPVSQTRSRAASNGYPIRSNPVSFRLRSIYTSRVLSPSYGNRDRPAELRRPRRPTARSSSSLTRIALRRLARGESDDRRLAAARAPTPGPPTGARGHDEPSDSRRRRGARWRRYRQGARGSDLPALWAVDDGLVDRLARVVDRRRRRLRARVPVADRLAPLADLQPAQSRRNQGVPRRRGTRSERSRYRVRLPLTARRRSTSRKAAGTTSTSRNTPRRSAGSSVSTSTRSGIRTTRIGISTGPNPRPKTSSKNWAVPTRPSASSWNR